LNSEHHGAEQDGESSDCAEHEKRQDTSAQQLKNPLRYTYLYIYIRITYKLKRSDIAPAGDNCVGRAAHGQQKLIVQRGGKWQ